MGCFFPCIHGVGSGKTAAFIIPLIEKLKDASKEDAKRIVIDFAERTIDEVYAFADGFYIMFPLKRYELAEELVGYIRGKR